MMSSFHPRRLLLLLPWLFLLLLTLNVAMCSNCSGFRRVHDIPRVDVSTFESVADFYESPHINEPMIITGLASAWTDDVTDFFQLLLELCPTADLPVMKKVRTALWAGLEAQGTWEMQDFIKFLHEEETTTEASEILYGFDLILKDECPALLEHFQIPRFFNECLFQTDVVRNELDKLDVPTFDWPTLMIGPPHSSSALHNDRDGLPFWMILLEGRKHWRILPYQVNYHLTPDRVTHTYSPPAAGHKFRGLVLENYIPKGQESYAFDIFHPDFDKFPDLCQAVVYDGVLGRGEVMYIPNSTPHGVVNLENTVAVTSNFFHPLDQARQAAMRRNCETQNVESGYSAVVCHYLKFRVTHRQHNPGPNDDLDYDEFQNDHFFLQQFHSEL